MCSMLCEIRLDLDYPESQVKDQKVSSSQDSSSRTVNIGFQGWKRHHPGPV